MMALYQEEHGLNLRCVLNGKMTGCLQFINSSSWKGERDKRKLMRKMAAIGARGRLQRCSGLLLQLSVSLNISIIKAGNKSSLALMPHGRRVNENHSHRGELGTSSYHVSVPHTHSLTWQSTPFLGRNPVHATTWLRASTVMVEQNNLNVPGQGTWERCVIPI